MEGRRWSFGFQLGTRCCCHHLHSNFHETSLDLYYCQTTQQSGGLTAFESATEAAAGGGREHAHQSCSGRSARWCSSWSIQSGLEELLLPLQTMSWASTAVTAASHPSCLAPSACRSCVGWTQLLRVNSKSKRCGCPDKASASWSNYEYSYC